METLLNEYENNLKAREVRSRKVFIVQIKHFLRWCSEENIDPLDFSDEDAQEWLVSMIDSELPPSRKTINWKISILKGFYQFLQRQGKIPFSPFFYLKALKLGRSLPKSIPSTDNLDALLRDFSILSHSDRMLKTIIEVLYGSGLRISEVLALKQEDIHWDSQTLTIHEKKTQRVRNTPATYASIVSLKEYLDEVRHRIIPAEELDLPYLFPQQGNTTIRCKLNRRLKRECARLGIPELTSHSFRHAAATHMLKAGAGLRQVQSFLAHENISSTECYTHLVKEDLKELIQNLHPREQRRTV